MTDTSLDMADSRTRQQYGSRTVAGLAYLVLLLYVVFYSWLSIQRHRTFQSNAMDLGYTDQVVWNTRHGRFLQFSTFENAPIDLPLSQFQRTDVLLAYHVELLLIPISLLYAIYESPITLLVLQAVGVGVGALPAFWLARDHLKSDWGGLVYALAYLLAPALQGAILSDFHAVSLTSSLFLFALYFLHARRYAGYFVVVVLAMLAKEDVPLLIVVLGLYALLIRRERMLGALTAVLGVAWFLIATQLIQPAYHGLPNSPFFHRITVFGPTIGDSVLNVIRQPMLLWRWLSQPQIVTYLGGLLASAGFTSLFSPLVLSLSAPVVAMNVFSTWSWTYSEGAHYSASIVPFVIVSGIYGLGFLARKMAKWTSVPRTWAVNGLATVALLLAGYHHYQIGISPVSKSYVRPRLTAHHRLAQELMALIPPDAALSTQSGLYPHLAHRERAYFFPAVNDAEYVFLDVAGPSFPITLEEVRVTAERLLRSGEFSVLAAREGYLLLKRGEGEGTQKALPGEFYSFARGDAGAIAHRLRVRFGDTIELLGYDYCLYNVVHAQQLPVTVTTYWRLLRPLEDKLALGLFFSRQDGAIVYHYDGPWATTLWYPQRLWQAGEVIRIQTPALSAGRLRDVMVAVAPSAGVSLADEAPAGDLWSAADRLVVDAGDTPVETYDNGTLLKLFSLP
jgi:uncharacterized membrane protein